MKPRKQTSSIQPLSTILPILVDGSIRNVDANKIPDREYRKALSIGVAELIHRGELKLADVT